MLDIAWPEVIVIGAVALVAIGPKDLPKVMHKLGQWTGKARGVMNDMRRAFEQLNYETEIAEKLRNEPSPTSPSAASPPSPTPPSGHDRTGTA